MKYNEQFIYEDEFSNDDEDLYQNEYELPLQTRIEPPVEDSELYYEDENELPLPDKDTTLDNYNTVTNPVSGVPEQQPYYEDEPSNNMNAPVVEPNLNNTLPAPPYEDEVSPMDPNAGGAFPAAQQPEAPMYEDELDPGIMGGNTAPPAPPEAPPMDPGIQPPPPADPNMGQGMEMPPAPDEEDNTMFDDTYDADPYVGSYTDEKNPETRVGNSSEVTTGRPISVEDISRINELKKINSQLMRIRGLLEKELKLKYNKVEDKLNEAIEYFRIIISNLDSYVNQVDDIIMKYKRFIMTILTQINILKQQELSSNDN